VENKSAPSAREQLESLAVSRELALGRILLPWRYVLAWAIVMNICMLPVVLPIVLSDGWTLLIQGAFLAAGAALLLAQTRHQAVKRPLLRIQGGWILTVVVGVGGGLALAVGIYARSNDDPWLGAAALLINFAVYLVAYGGPGFLLRRQSSRLT
jgi:hypothetical protein